MLNCCRKTQAAGMEEALAARPDMASPRPRRKARSNPMAVRRSGL
jgi:hypothetical protein